MFLRQSTASQEILLGPFVDSTDGNTAETALTIANTDIKIFKEGGTTLLDKNSGGATHISNGYYSAVLDATDTNTVGQLEVNVKVAGALAVRRSYQVVEEAVYDALFAGGALGHVSNQPVNVTQWDGTAVGTATVRANLINIAGAAIATGTAQLGVNVVNWGGTATGSALVRGNIIQANGVAVPSTAGRIEANTTHWGGTAVASAVVPANCIQISGDETAADNAESFFDGTGYAGTNNVIPTVTVVTNKTGYELSGTGVTAVQSGLATQTSVDDIPTVSEFNARTLPSADYFVVGDYTAPPTVNAIADQVWEEAQADHLASGSMGFWVNAIALATSPLSTMIELVGVTYYRFKANALEVVGDKVDTLLGRVTATLFSGITSIGDWVRRIVRKDAGTAGMIAAEAEIDTGGTSTFTGMTDSLEAIRDAGGGGGGGGDPWTTDVSTGYTYPEAGAVLKTVYDKAALITASNVQFSSMVNTEGYIDGEIVIGDDYLAANNNSFPWTFTPNAGFVAATSTFRFGGSNDSGTSTWLVTTTPVDNGNGTWTAYCEMPKAISSLLLEGMHNWSAECVSVGGIEITKKRSGKKVKVVRKWTN
jgi:hypothetical protein